MPMNDSANYTEIRAYFDALVELTPAEREAHLSALALPASVQGGAIQSGVRLLY